MPSPRRRFLQSAAGLAGFKALASPAPLLPTVKLGKHQVTRMIVGANPMYGFSHFNNIYDQVMRDWYTPERVCEVLRRCQEQGLNTWQFSYRERAFSDLKRHRDEGGTMQWILLSGREIEEDLSLIPKAAALNPIGIVHHGGTTDRRFRAGEHAKVREFLKGVRDAGVLAGMSTHNPQNLERVESENWDIDFYMTCCYHVTRTPEEVRKITGELPLAEVFLEGDPARMFKVVRQTKKTCLAFKILAAGRRIQNPREVDQAFQFAFDSIKPQDAVIVGMFPRIKDEVKENAERVRRILA
ncbi:MAG: hypothetical protein HY822_12655 [Acidobacteria bacterium]|nr:hypothetical protein [Acidobacteriota bacterium]